MSPRRGARAGQDPNEGQVYPDGGTRPIRTRVPWWAEPVAGGDREGHYPPLAGEPGYDDAAYRIPGYAAGRREQAGYAAPAPAPARGPVHPDDSRTAPVGYGPSGPDPSGYDQPGREPSGRQQPGREQSGRDQDGYDEFEPGPGGYDQPGYDEPGYDQPGYGEDGYDEATYDGDRYDEDGYDELADGSGRTPGTGELFLTKIARAHRAPKRRNSMLVLGTLVSLLVVSIAVVLLGAGGSRAGRASVTDGTSGAATSTPAGANTLDPGAGTAAGTAAGGTGTTPSASAAAKGPGHQSTTPAPRTVPVAPTSAAHQTPRATVHNPRPAGGGVNVNITVDIG